MSADETVGGQELDAAASLLDGAPLGAFTVENLRSREVIFLVGLEHTVSWVSDSVIDVLGWSPDDLIGTELPLLFHDEDRETAARVRDGLRVHPEAAGASEAWVLRMRRRDGVFRWMSVNIAPVLDEDERLVGVASAWIDVDDLIRVRREADATQAKVHAIVDSLFDPHVELRAIRDGQGSIADFEFTDANGAACDRLGRTWTEVVGCRLGDLDPRRRATGLFAACVATVESGQPLMIRSAWVGSDGDGVRLFEASGARLEDGISLTWRDAPAVDEVAELSAATSHSRYELLAEAPTDVIVVGGTDGVLEWVSDAVTDLLGWSPSQLVRKPVVGLVHPEDAPLAMEVQLQVLAGKAQTVSIRLETADGGWRWVRVATRPVLNDDGKVIGRVGLWRDAEQELAEIEERAVSGERYRFLIENASDVVFQADHDSVLEWISPSVRELVGRSPEDLVGRSPIEFMHPDDLDDLAEVTDAVHRGETARFRGRVVRPDGTTRWVAATVRPTHDDGSFTGSVGAIRDIDDETRALEALAASERRFHLLADNASDLVAELDRDGIIKWVSPNVGRSLGRDPETLVGTALAEIVHPGDRDITAALHQVEPPAARGEPRTRLLRLRHADGSYRWMSSTAAQLPESTTPPGFVVGMRDVDELVRSRQVAESERARAVATFDTFLDPHVVFEAVRDASGEVVDLVFVDANDAACAYNGVAREDLLGARLLELLPASTDTGLMDRYRHVLATGQPLILDDFEYPHELLEEARTYDIRASKLGDGLSFTWRDVTERHREVTQLAARATRDELTGLGNRAAIIDELQRALDAGTRSKRPIGVLMVDLDHFKNVNDSLGHPVGDELLKAAAARLTHTVRAGDLVGRLGGDEFVVVMRDLDDGGEAVTIAGRIVGAFRAPLTSGELDFYATASVGITVAGFAHPSTPADLLREADTALYRAKSEGRDRASMFNDDLRERALERLTIESQLRPALANGELELWYQPEVELDTGRVIAVEALLRWRHPSGEIYTADRFIEIAEEIGLIHDIGEWVFARACQQASTWAALRPDEPLTVRVNLSALQLAESSLLASLDRALAGSGVDPTLLCVEITETAFLHETAMVRSNLEALRARGLHIALDDFGTGYASLAYLREFPIHVIKIDRSFTQAMLDDDYDRRLIAGIIALAELLDMRITAEGIEEPEQAALLRELGCTSAQGYLYSRAVPAAEAEDLFDHRFA